MAKSANLYVRIDPDVRNKQSGLPFDVKIPHAKPLDMSILSEAQLSEELEKGYADMNSGRTKDARKAFADMRKNSRIR